MAGASDLTDLYIVYLRIGKGSGYRSAELATLKEDETLAVGGKEIQVRVHSYKSK